ncbi:MAG: tetratricopeptide repeat protein [Spirulina sp. SIO3F2]|nr:tetratricopeptide repeat protein [Spirulina sp. SIO3F2]
MFGFFNRQPRRQSEPVQSLTDAEYGVLFEQLLAGVLVEGWDEARVLALVAQGGGVTGWAAWVERWDWEGADGVRLGQLVGRLQGVEGLDGLWRGLEKVVARLVLADKGRAVEVETVSSDSSLDADAVIQEAVQYFQAGKYQEALDTLTRAVEIAPQEHKLWYIRGELMSVFKQYEEAIVSYDKVLEIKPDMHEAWLNRGVALEKLGENEEAIVSYDKALEIKPDMHEAWFGRGNALKNLGRYEEAIVSFEKTIEIEPDFYDAWNSKGIVLCDFLKEYENALNCFGKALQIKMDDYVVWSNQGVVLEHMGRYKEAIASSKKAIDFQPNFFHPWSIQGTSLSALGRYEEAIASFDKTLELKLDYYKAWLNRGINLSALGRYEEAIASIDKAVELKPDYYKAWNDRAIAVYSAFEHRLAFTNLQPSAITLHLTKRGYEGSIETYQEGLKYCPQATHPLGWGYLMHWMGKRHYDHGKTQPNRETYNLDALNCYTSALQTLTPQNHPTEHLQLLQDLIKVHLALGNRDTAQDHQLAGLEILKQLLNAAKSQQQKRRIEAQFHSFRQLTVDVLLENHQPIAALTSAELNKNRCLAILANDPVSPDYKQIQRLVTADTTLIAWHLSAERLTTFIIQANDPEPQYWVQDVQPFLDWLKDWDTQYTAYRPKEKKAPDDTPTKQAHPWRTGMAERLTKLAEILQIPAIADHLTQTPHLILVPHRDLHRLPLHALFTDGVGATKGGLPRQDVVYLPSIQTGLNLQTPPPPALPTNPTILSIENPQNNLNFAHIESAVINTRFQHPTHLTAATHTQTLTALQSPHDLLHFTGHAAYNSRQPAQSALALQAEDELTAQTLRSLNLSPYRLIYLAACETALTGQSSIEDEYVGLVSACLQAHAHAVISTLWTVEEISSAWLAIRFYQLWLDEKLPMAQALHQAQTWLRTITDSQLAAWLEQLAQGVENPDTRNLITDEMRKLESSSRLESSCPYGHPYYWAAFTLTGGILR